jgi:hypothetical protein
MLHGYERDLATEQLAFLGRPRGTWDAHLARTRGFLGQGLQEADPGKPVLILGAGSGLEVPWDAAPRGTVGWDADPWSRIRTFIRHRRWVPWVFADITGGLADLEALVRRNASQPWSGKRVRRDVAAARIAGLLHSLRPEPKELRAFLESRRPGTVLAANLMGQFGVVAQRCVERAFGKGSPWNADPEAHDALAEALDDWTARAIRAVLSVLRDSGANLWLVHDRASFQGTANLELRPFSPIWRNQIGGSGDIDASDALCGVEVGDEIGVEADIWERWLWPIAEDQVHLMEAMAFRRVKSSPDGASRVPSS